MPYISDLISSDHHLFIALTETWLQDNHKEAELKIDRYKLYRKDRNRIKAKYGCSSGGVAIYLREDIVPSFKILLEFSNGVNEALMLYSEKDNIIICVIYRQPTNEKHVSGADELNELLSCVEKKINSLGGCTPELYVCGDFNIPHTMINNVYTPSKNCNTQLLEILNDFTLTFNLNQVIQKPTHRDGNILDFLLTNNTENIFNYQCTHTIYSDHFNVSITTHTNFNFNRSKEESYKNLNSNFDNYNFYSENIDWDSINKDLGSINWTDELENHTNCDDQYNLILQNCLTVVKKHVPVKDQTKKHRTIPRDRRILMRKRRKLVKQYNKTFTKTLQNKIREKLIDVELEMSKSHQAERQKNEIKATSKIKRNPKYFYSYVKRFSKTKPKVGPLYNKRTKKTCNG